MKIEYMLSAITNEYHRFVVLIQKSSLDSTRDGHAVFVGMIAGQFPCYIDSAMRSVGASLCP